MFKDFSECLKMIEGSYRKLKCYYYYNNNFLVMRKKIMEFESNEENMYQTFNNLANILYHPIKSKEYVQSLLEQIDFYVIPKKFETETLKNNSVISNTLSRDKKMRSVNFFINAPIEIHILDTLFTVFLSKMDNDKKIVNKNAYGNTINYSALFHDDNINYENRILFNRYFDKYSSWRNNAFETLEDLYSLKKDSILISLDMKSFFYSISFSFDELKIVFDNHELLEKIKNLKSIIEKVYSIYFERIKEYRKDLKWIKEKKYPLPIGLFSSMFLSNIYIKDFDYSISKLPDVMYYGRYVDDLLIVLERKSSENHSIISVLEEYFVKTNILKKSGDDYEVIGYDNLFIQQDKIKILYINHDESRAIIDIYNDTIKIIPSQMNPLPYNNLDLSNFDESVYNIENFTKEKKIRDIGIVGIDTFKVGKYFSSLPRKYSQININDTKNEIDKNIVQIEKFFTGSQSIEYYSNWLNYFYFLILTNRYRKIKCFCQNTKRTIENLKGTSLDRQVFRKNNSINKRAKDYLLLHLDICLHVALCLDLKLCQQHFKAILEKVKFYSKCNMFNHNLVTFPLANLLEYDKCISYCRMNINDFGKIEKEIENSFKFVWSPRFIHYHELLLLLFYVNHIADKNSDNQTFETDKLVEKFKKINFLNFKPFNIKSELEEAIKGYKLRTLTIPNKNMQIKNVSVAIGNINFSKEKCINACVNSSTNLTIGDKEIFLNVLGDSYKYLKNKTGTMFLVMPELCFPIYWISDLLTFSKRSNIGIVTGIQYIKGDSNIQYNYIATILPFKSGKSNYNNVFIHIRGKNDYSPIEFVELAKKGFSCKNKKEAEYQVFKWNGINLSTMICYELTDVMARALLKGRSDFIAVPVFNPDTTYFSNIIDSSARDLHCFIVQSNTSFYGDSRITGPYDRDSKDVFKIKGGENNCVVIGTVDYLKYRQFQETYDENLTKKINNTLKTKSKKKANNYSKVKPDIKPFSARFKVYK